MLRSPRPVRARDLGIVIGAGTPGAANAITDVAGVRVGHCTLVEGAGALARGRGPVRTGVTVVLPHDEGIWTRPVFAGCHRLNGNGELTGLEWVRESGMLSSPVGLTNTHSVGVVRDALVRAEVDARRADELFWGLPVVGETWDGVLNDINGFHVRPEHVEHAWRTAAGGPVAEGNVGSGTGMISHGFKGGIGTSSRVLDATGVPYTVGVLVQANHGRRSRLTVNGAPVGLELGPADVPLPVPPEAAVAVQGGGSIIVVVATDAPLLPHQCTRLAQRASFGIARTGGVGEHFSGDLVIAFATGNRLRKHDYGAPGATTQPVTMFADAAIDPLFDAVVEATEESILNALVAAQTMTGRDGVTAHALPHARLTAALDARGLCAVHPNRTPLIEERS